MKKIKQMVVFVAIYALSATIFAAKTMSPVGFWKTMDDKTGKPKSLVHITQSADNLLQGEVVKLLEGATATTCAHCKGDLKDKPIVGMTILGGLRPSDEYDNYWVDGQILDPKNGKTYSCNIQLIEDGQKIQIRGFIGLPMFGRTQTWERVSNPKSMH